MPIIDGIKYACASCIAGHRSSKCTHTSRPLQEIRRKGRPTSQCGHCRQLRKTKSVHVKCDCADRAKEAKSGPRVLPNGLADAMLLASLAEGDDRGVGSSNGGQPQTKTEKSGVTLLLNPCNCLQGGTCSCCTSAPAATGGKKAMPGDKPAGGCCGGGGSSSSMDVVFEEPTQPVTPFASGSSCCAPPPSSAQPSDSPPNDIDVDPSKSPASTYPFPQPLPPRYSIPGSFPLPLPALPSPPTTLFTPSTHGTSSCFCGTMCACVGCAVHDPQSKKRPSPGSECDGGGCRCGQAGQRGCEGSSEGKKKARMVDGGTGGGCCGSQKAPMSSMMPEEPTMGGCCGSSSTRRTDSVAALPAGSGVDLPALWSLAEEDLGAGGEPAPAPLPSLRTLWPALLTAPSSPSLELDCELVFSGAFPLTSSSTSYGALFDPSADVCTAPPPPPSSTYLAAPEQLGCAAMYSDEPFAPACGSNVASTSVGLGADEGDEDDGACACSTDCGCRRPLVASSPAAASTVYTEDAEGETDEEWVTVATAEEQRRLEEIERKAEMGLFG